MRSAATVFFLTPILVLACGGAPFTMEEADAGDLVPNAFNDGSSPLPPLAPPSPPPGKDAGGPGAALPGGEDGEDGGAAQGASDSGPAADGPIGLGDAALLDSALPIEACAEYPHTDGVGQSWSSCDPTIDAARACAAYAASVGAAGSDCITEWAPPTIGEACTPQTTPISGGTAFVCYAPGSACDDYCWFPGSVVGTCACTQVGTWQ